MSRHATPRHAPAHAAPRPPRGARPSAPQPAAERLQRTLGNHLSGLLGERGPVLRRTCACGGSCADCAGREEESRGIQARLRVGPPGDAYEREADAVASRILSAPDAPAPVAAASAAPGVLRRSALEEDLERRTPSMLRTAPRPGRLPAITPGVQAYVAGLPGRGAALPPASRAFFEPRLGTELGSVRLHADGPAAAAAAAVGARAFTLGSDVVFGAGEYAPDTLSGQHLLAHELVHVVQQGGGAAPAGGPRVSRMPAPVVQRTISPELDRIDSLLSYGLFDWAVRDREAIEALELLESLPRFQQAVFFADAGMAERLRENLPDARVAELDRLRAEVGPVPASSVVEGVRSRLSYGLFDWAIRDYEAVEALELLKQLSGTELAVALASVDYGRLMDNLPESRRPELIDLLARGLGTGGTRETEEGRFPGAGLNSVRFLSDHGVMKGNRDWTASGASLGEPEWSGVAGRRTSHPISQTRDTAVEVELDLDVTPLTAPAGTARLEGRSDGDFLRFDQTETLRGGRHQKVRMTALGKTPNEVRALRGRRVSWFMEWNGWTRQIGATSHDLFITLAPPLDPGEVTWRRMELSTRLAQAVGETDPHKLVRGIMTQWGAYNLFVTYDNAWEMGESESTLSRGAQCIDIVRFVNGIIRQIGMTGTAVAVVVSALPGAAMVPVEEPWGVARPGLWKVPEEAKNGRTSRLVLLDGNGCGNNYEAALKFNDGASVAYYPGGVSQAVPYLTPTDVLYIFQCLAWVSREVPGESRIEVIEGTYPGGSCTLGGVVTCH